MSRLVQGDVGCGKTALAFGALWAVAQCGYQGALMAPTEILARQHWESAQKTLAPLGIRCGLLLGGIIGIVLPGLPTVPFVLLAAFAAARGSQRLRDWLLAHAQFGPMIRDWEREGAVSRRAKRLAIGMMALCAIIMFMTAPKWWMAAVGSAIMACVSAWLWHRAEPRQ